MTTPIAPGPDSSGMASGVSEISSLSWASCALLRRDARMRSDHAPRGVGDDQSAGNLQDGQRDAEKMQHEAAEKQKRNQNDEHPETGLQSSDPVDPYGSRTASCEENRHAAGGSTMGNSARNVAAAE